MLFWGGAPHQYNGMGNTGVVDALREKGKWPELAVMRYLWPDNVYDVIDILKGFVEQQAT